MTQELKLGLMLGYWVGAGPGDQLPLVRAAEDVGFDSVWSAESYGSDVFTPLAWVGAHTSRIKLGTGLCQLSARTPVCTAMTALTLDRLSGGRVVVQPTVSWHRSEYDALGVPYVRRGALLDEHLAAWSQLWQPGPASFSGRHYAFSDVYLEPKPHSPSGPALWFGGQTLHDRLLRRLVAQGSGFHPLGQPSDTDLQRLATAMQEADRAHEDLEMIGGIRGILHDDNRPADLAESVAAAVPRQLARGFSTFCLKPSQFTDDAAELPAFCRETVRLLEAAAA